MAFPESGRGYNAPRYAPHTGGGSGGGSGSAPQPDVNATIRQIADQSAGQAVQAHEQIAPHLGEGDVRRLTDQQHGAATHPGLATQTDVDHLATRVDHVEQTVAQLPQPQPPQQVTPQDVAAAVQADPQPFVTALRPHLPIGGAGLSETEVRDFAKDEITHAAAGARPDGWVSVPEVEQLIQDKIDDGTLAAGTDLAALITQIDAVAGRVPPGTDPLTTASAQRQALANLFGLPVANLDEPHVRTRIQEWAQQGMLSPTQVHQMATVFGIDPATIDGFDTRVTTIAAREFDRRSILRFFRWRQRQTAVVPTTPAVIVPSDEMARRAFLVLAGGGLLLAGFGVLWWATHQGEPYAPSGTTGGTSSSGETPVSSGLDYSSMSVDQANQVLRTLPIPDYTGPGQRQVLNETLPDDQVGIATGVLVNGVSGGDTVAYEGGETVNADITDGAFYKVPKSQGRDAFVALVVIGQKVYHNMNHAQPLPEWNLPSIG